MNILRKTRKSKVKISKKRIILLIFTLIMVTFAWIAYIKILSPTIQMHINSWNIAVYVDSNGNKVAEDDEEWDKEDAITVDCLEMYPGMYQDVMEVLIKNNGEVPAQLSYDITDIVFLGESYTIQSNAAAYRQENPGAFCIQKNGTSDIAGIKIYELINATDNIPFQFRIEHTYTVEGGTEGYLRVKTMWLGEGKTDAQNELDSKWGYEVTRFQEQFPDVAPLQFKVKLNTIGLASSSRTALTQFITPEHYGDYVNYPIDLNEDGDTTNDWKIFFEDHENIYIIAADYVKNTWIPENIMTASTGATGFYGAYTPASKLIVNSIENAVKYRYMLVSSTATDKRNYKATASYLTPSYWEDFIDSRYADSAIGASTIEMFVKSWNQKYNGNDNYTELKYEWDQVYFGYRVNNTFHTQVNGYENAPLYFPRVRIVEESETESDSKTENNPDSEPETNPDSDPEVVNEEVIDENTNTDTELEVTPETDQCYVYWLASPSGRLTDSGSYGNYVIGVLDSGYVGAGGYENDEAAIRPVVRLKKGIEGTLVTIEREETDGNTVANNTIESNEEDLENTANVVYEETMNNENNIWYLEMPGDETEDSENNLNSL